VWTVETHPVRTVGTHPVLVETHPVRVVEAVAAARWWGQAFRSKGQNY
jgi:hypothetical protein